VVRAMGRQIEWWLSVYREDFICCCYYLTRVYEGQREIRKKDKERGKRTGIRRLITGLTRRQFNSARNRIPYFSNTHFNSILTSMHVSQKWFLPF
jgi:hypothetical protein